MGRNLATRGRASVRRTPSVSFEFGTTSGGVQCKPVKLAKRKVEALPILVSILFQYEVTR